MIRRPPRSTPLYSSAASDVYKRQVEHVTLILAEGGGRKPNRINGIHAGQTPDGNPLPSLCPESWVPLGDDPRFTPDPGRLDQVVVRLPIDHLWLHRCHV